MIGRLRGSVLEKKPPLLLIEVCGIGYEVYMPTICFYRLPDLGKESTVFTQLVIKKDTNILYGFNNLQERTLFCELIKTNGVGTKLALIILSSIPFEQFIYAISHEDLTKLVKIPGIGKKTAERLIIEMKDRLKSLHNDFFISESNPFPAVLMKSSSTQTAQEEAIAALVALGYKPKNASRMIRKIAEPDDNRSTLIRKALRAML